MLLLVNSLYSQKTIKEYVNDGDKYFMSGKYYAANDSYWNALKFDTTDAEVAYKYAESLSRSLNYCEEQKWYRINFDFYINWCIF